MTPDLWVIITAILASIACGVIGSFLVLRQNAMLGDAISHAVLPGLVIAFLVTSSRGVVPMIIGAAAMGLATAYLTEALERTRHVYRDGALGIVFTFLFAVGVILVAVYADQIDLDQDCVLFWRDCLHAVGYRSSRREIDRPSRRLDSRRNCACQPRFHRDILQAAQNMFV